MVFANPWGLLGLLSLPVIAAIHLFHRRFPPLLVAGAHLWGAETRVTTAGRSRDRLPVTATLLLELLAGLIFSLALSQPRFSKPGDVAHFVVVLDDSASMAARPAEGPSFREIAITRLGERMDTMDRDSRVTLIRSGIQPTLLGGRAMLWDEAQTVLADWQPRAPLHSFHAAWDEAARIVGADGQFLFLTDRIPEDEFGLPRGMEIVSVGRRLPNVAIAAARRTFDSVSSEGRLFVRVTNTSTAAARVSLIVEAGGQVVMQQSLDVPGEGSVPLETSVPGGLGRLTIKISAPGDGLAVDDAVVLIEPQVRLVTVALEFPPDSIEAHLTQRVLGAARDVQLGSVEQADLVIGLAAVIPEVAPEQWWFGIGPLNLSPVIRNQARDLMGPYLVERQHPLMDGIVLGGVVWGGVQPTDLDLSPLISAGRIPLLGQLAGLAATAYVMNIDLSRSNLSESPDWPILLTNLLEGRRDELPGLRIWNYRLNETIRFRAERRSEDSTERELTLVLPSGSERPIVRDRNDVVEIARLDETGLYAIREGERIVGEFAVNFFDDVESSLAELAPGARPPEATSEAVRLAIDDPYSWLMALAMLMLLAAMLADWYVLRPQGVLG
ncbi:MAG: BatA domain-containing protein [Planctomycetaceae bacterium]